MALAQNPSIAALSNLVLYYDASNVKSFPGAGTSIYDMSGNNNTGTLTNGPLWSAANNGVISFDGTNDYITCGVSSSINAASTAFTWSCWFKSNNIAAEQILFSTVNASATTGFLIEIYTSKMLLAVYPAGTWAYANTTLSSNTWYYLSVTYNSGSITYYLNGVADGTTSRSFTAATGPTYISSWFYNSFYFINGYISQVAFYNTTLTAAQIKQNYDATKGRFVNTLFAPTDISGLKLWLDVDDPRTLFSNTSGTTRATTDGTAVALWADKSGNGNNVSQSTGSYQPLLKTSVQNNKNIIRFDGSNDYLVSGANLGISGASARTFFCVTKFATVASTQYTALGYGSTTNSSGFSLTANAGNWYFSGYNNDTTGGTADTNYNIHSFYYDGTNVYWYTNGGNISSFPVAKSLSTTDSTIKIGTRQDIVSYLNGDVAEVLVYNSALSVSNRLKVEQYLQNKWGVVTPFLPTQISGLQLWLDSSDSGSLFQDSAAVIPATKDGDPVGCWKDKSGNSRNATQSTTTQRPLLKTSIQNSRNILRFDGSDDYFGLSAGNYGDSLTCFIVYKWTMASTPGNAGYLYAFAGSVSPKQKLNVMYMNGAQPTYYFGERTNTAYIGNTTKDAYFVNTTTFASPYAAANLATYNNGVPLSISSFGSIGSGGATNDNVIGADKITSGIQTFTGDMAEIIVYNSVLSTAQRQQVEAYLNQKWGVF